MAIATGMESRIQRDIPAASAMPLTEPATHSVTNRTQLRNSSTGQITSAIALSHATAGRVIDWLYP